MKNIMKLFKLIAITIILVLGMAIIGCKDGSTNGDDSTNGKKITLVCLGDSLTAGYGATASFEEDKSKSYPAYLEKKDNISVINAGVSGDTTTQALARVDSDVLPEYPEIIIILLGANDFFKNIPFSTTQDNFQQIIEKVDDGNRKIYLAKFYTDAMASLISILGLSGTFSQYNDMFNTLVTSSSNIELIEDIWTGVWGVREHMSDPIHPNAKGYEIMADNIYKVVQPYLQTLKE